ncbi:MAG: hypothetical protein ACR2MS_10285 [Weeksellaceae bacterium]
MANKLEVMNSVLNRMEDIQNTQRSLIEKLGHVEVDLFNIESKELDEKLAKVHQSASESMDIIKEAIESFEIKRNKLQEGL